MRTHTTDSDRLAAVSVTVPLGAILVDVSPDAEAANLTLTPQATDDEVAADAIAEATITEVSDTLAVAVLAAVRRDRVITPAGALAHGPGGGVEAVLTVPARCRLRLSSQDGTITITGPAGQVTAASGNGSVYVEHAETVVAETTNGAIRVGEVVNVEALSTNGAIRVGRVGGSAVLRTDNGAIRAHATTSDISARATNGTVRITTEGGFLPSPAAHASTGVRVCVVTVQLSRTGGDTR